MPRKKTGRIDRRQFVHVTAAAATAACLPGIVTADKAAPPILVGAGEYRYEVSHDWLRLPSRYHWQTTHDVAVDKQGHVYVLHEGNPQLKDHPAIFVFVPDGTFIRAFGQQFQGGGHGLELMKREERSFSMRPPTSG